MGGMGKGTVMPMAMRSMIVTTLVATTVIETVTCTTGTVRTTTTCRQDWRNAIVCRLGLSASWL